MTDNELQASITRVLRRNAEEIRGTMTQDERDDIAGALSEVQRTQTEYWEALSALEGTVEGLELDGTTDYECWTVDDVIEAAEEAEEEEV